jgi:organic hydroperoxide reductase OsmC/OhrA
VETLHPPRHTHHYRARCTWSGSTAGGYEHYDRNHEVVIEGQHLECSADPAFRGDAMQLNPEQLVLAAAASCQLLSFLAVAARARVTVLAYGDDAEAEMRDEEGPMQLNAIILRPRITVAPGTNVERVLHLIEVAHRECFIANSLRTEQRIEPSVRVAGELPGHDRRTAMTGAGAGVEINT